MLINKKILAALFLSVTSVAGQNCNLVVPTAPLTATGLATPWKVSTTTGSPAPCSATSFGGSVFVEATIFDTKTNLFSAYFPLVVNDPANAAANPAGTAATAAQAVAVGATGYIGGPAVAPVVPVLTATSIVGIWIGGNNGITTLIATGTGAASSLVTGVCVNGVSATDQFGEYAYCNAVAFWTAVNAALAKKAIVVPPLGVTNKGLPCPTVRSFSMVDQDQSDNVLTTQLLVQTVTVNAATGLTTKVLGLQLAQDTVANRAALNLVSAITNASDNRLVSANVVAALGCAPFQVPNLAEVVAGVNQGPLVTTQALSEIMALTYPEATPALVPALDPMVVTTTNGVAAANMIKLNLYRAGVNQAPVTALTQADTAIYCANMVKATPLFLATHYDVLNAAPSLVPAVGSTMLNLLCARFGVSFANLNCATLNPALANPITVTVNRDNVAIANNLLQLFPALTPATLKAQPTPAAGGPAGAAADAAAGAAADAAAGGAAGGAAGDQAATVAPGVANNNANGQNAASLPITTVAAAGGALVGGLVLLFVALMAFGVITCKRRETGVTSRV